MALDDARARRRNQAGASRPLTNLDLAAACDEVRKQRYSWSTVADVSRRGAPWPPPDLLG